jgi:hypothetical protein
VRVAAVRCVWHMLAESGSDDGVNNVVAKGVGGKAGSVDGGEWQ